jgi:hypothetical protein
MNTELITLIHGTPGHWVTAITGGGTTALSRLLGVPGASRTLLEATIPYAQTALTAYLGKTPAQAASSQTARALAMAAFQRARQLTAPQGTTASGADQGRETPLFGLGASAALVTDRSRRGDDHCFVAIQSRQASWEFSLTFGKTGRQRSEQEQICGELILQAMQMAQTGHHIPLADELHQGLGLDTSDHATARVLAAPTRWQGLFNGEHKSTWAAAKSPLGVFPGAFNPLHEGHRQMVAVAQKILGHEVILEISAFNVDKPPLDYFDLQERELGTQGYAMVFSNAPTFIEKSFVFPAATFVVGSDTIERIADPKYYGNLVANRDAALGLLQQRGHRFLVFGRSDGEGFIGLEHLELPPSLRAICDGVPEARFRIDLASRDLRQN